MDYTGEHPLVAFILDRAAEVQTAAVGVHHVDCEKVDHLAGERTPCTCDWPGQIQRMVEAVRQVLDEHMDNGGYVHGDFGVLVRSGPPGKTCLACVDTSTLTCGALTKFSEMAAWPCWTVRLLALPWAGHKGYREEWGLPAPAIG